jgi:hypothetical protein
MINNNWMLKKQEENYNQQKLFSDDVLNSSKTIKTLPKIINQAEKFKLILSEDVLNKIKYICSVFPDKEWSGVLFYKTTGSMQDIENLIIEVVNLYPLDLGTGGFTSFEYNDEYNKYIVRNLHMLDYKQGIIHSHNSMPAFFSGTDTDTLAENAHLFAGMLSLIVNNAGSYTAKLAVYKTSLSEGYVSFKDFDYSDKSISQKYEKQFVDIYNCNIVYETGVIDKEIEDSVTNLKTKPELSYVNRKKAEHLTELPASYNSYSPYSSYKPYSSFDNSKPEIQNSEIDCDINEQMYMELLGRVITFNPLWIASITYSCDDFTLFIKDIVSYVEDKYKDANSKFLNNDYIERVNNLLEVIIGNSDIKSLEIFNMVEYLFLEIDEILVAEKIMRLSAFWKKLFNRLKETFEFYLNTYEEEDNELIINH